MRSGGAGTVLVVPPPFNPTTRQPPSHPQSSLDGVASLLYSFWPHVVFPHLHLEICNDKFVRVRFSSLKHLSYNSCWSGLRKWSPVHFRLFQNVVNPPVTSSSLLLWVLKIDVSFIRHERKDGLGYKNQTTSPKQPTVPIYYNHYL